MQLLFNLSLVFSIILLQDLLFLKLLQSDLGKVLTILSDALETIDYYGESLNWTNPILSIFILLVS